jgi:inorganic phosphate transporter, PiT family
VGAIIAAMNLLFASAVIAIVVVLLFDFTNGFHDTANILASVIASRAMTPAQAVLLVGVFEFLGPLLGGTAVADTIGSTVDLRGIDAASAIGIVFCGLLGAIVWNLVTWWRGIPSSSSHALVGGLAGAVLVAAGADHVVWGFDAIAAGGAPTGIAKVVLALLLSPLLGFWVAFALQRVAARLLAGARPIVNRDLRRLQFLTAAWLAFSHGANDGQKSMGILTLVLMLGGLITHFAVPRWVMLACALALTLGVLTGGWRIVRTLGFAIYKLRPLHALDSQLASAGVIFAAAMLGAPTSTTHVVATTIMGVGYAERPKAVRWSKAGEIAATWTITIPGAALVAMGLLLAAQHVVRWVG